MNFSINENVLCAIDDYHRKSLAMQKYHFEGNLENLSLSDLKDTVDDDLVFNVPIYDMIDRRYAGFSSFIDALMRPNDDPKGNSRYFDVRDMSEQKCIVLFYLFRITGSGINYVPKKNHDSEPFGTHGFGNCWLVDTIAEDDYDIESWMSRLDSHEGPFSNNKGYIIPQFTFKEAEAGGHLKYFIQNYAVELCDFIYRQIEFGETIIGAVDAANEWLIMMGFRRQNFVLSATMSDIAEYFPHLIDPKSMIYAGTNAKKCIRAIFAKEGKCSVVEFESQCIQFLSDRYNTTPYSAEDSRLCDVIRYFRDYQSSHHVEANGGKKYKNNSILKLLIGPDEYIKFAEAL